jgi:putative ABC transport system ATP-binding protein
MSPVSVRQLTKTYGQGDFAVGAVRHVDLDIAAGEVVLIMGPSRSGKTTLLMLGAMLRPTSGSITVDGIDLATAAERDLPPLRARQFGFIFQDFNLLSALDVVEKVELACNVAGVTSRAANERATALLNRLGLGARLLRQIATEDGRSVVIVSHDQRLKEIADRVLWLEDGEFRQLAAMVTDPSAPWRSSPTTDRTRSWTGARSGSARHTAKTSSGRCPELHPGGGECTQQCRRLRSWRPACTRSRARPGGATWWPRVRRPSTSSPRSPPLGVRSIRWPPRWPSGELSGWARSDEETAAITHGSPDSCAGERRASVGPSSLLTVPPSSRTATALDLQPYQGLSSGSTRRHPSAC